MWPCTTVQRRSRVAAGGGDEDDIVVGNSRNPPSPRTGFLFIFYRSLARSRCPSLTPHNNISDVLSPSVSLATDPSIIATGCRYTHYTHTHAHTHSTFYHRYARRATARTHTASVYAIMHVHILYYYA